MNYLSTLESTIKAVELIVELINKANKQINKDIISSLFDIFTVSYDFCCDAMNDWLIENLGYTYVDGIPRNELFRISAEHILIDNVENWFEYHKARNITSHTYNEIEAEKVFNTAKSFISDAKILLENLEAKND